MLVFFGCLEVILLLMLLIVVWVIVFFLSGSDSLLLVDIKEEMYVFFCCFGELGMGYFFLFNVLVILLCFFGLWMMLNWYFWIFIVYFASRLVVRF